eukprot:gene20259-22243_t
MTTALVSAFYDINDVIQQSKHRPSSLSLQQNNFNFSQRRNESLLARRHSTNSANQHKPVVSSNNYFNNMPASPTTSQDNYNKLFAFQNAKERSASLTGLEESGDNLQQRGKQRASTNSSRYKTELCRPYEENGTCKYGDKCQFAHGIHEIRSLNRHPKYKTELCRTFHTIGFCPYGPRCHFVHKAEEIGRPINDSRKGSMSSVGSSPPSPTPSMESLQSPFVNIPTPTTPSLNGDVFVFGDDCPASISPPSSMSGASSGSTSPVNSPFPLASPMSEGFPGPKPTPCPGQNDINLHSPAQSIPLKIPPTKSVCSASDGETSPPTTESPCSSSDDNDSDPFGPRRLPIFNKLA